MNSDDDVRQKTGSTHGMSDDLYGTARIAEIADTIAAIEHGRALQQQYFETDAVGRAARAAAERLENELRGAWRAGYDYLHVFDPETAPLGTPPTETFTVEMAVYPSDREQPPSPEGYRYSYTYDLADVDDAEVRARLREDGNRDD